MAAKRNALGRGLDSLISFSDIQTAGSSAINDIRIELIKPNPNQPRHTFDETTIGELAASIRELGVVQPLSVRDTGDGFYQIIAGERRWRAASLAGLSSVPAYVRTASDSEMTEMALIENIQREDLNAIEVALAFKNLIDTYDLTQERLSERLGKKRTTIANHLRLLKLPAEIQLGLRDHKLDMGHAKALLSVDNPKQQLQLYNFIVREQPSVRKVEEMAKKLSQGIEVINKPLKTTTDNYVDFQKQLAGKFNLPVKISTKAGGKGTLTFSFNDETQLKNFIQQIIDSASNN